MNHFFIRTIHLKTIDNIMIFCYLTNQLDGDVNIKQNQHIVNGKSILGLMSLNLLNPAIVEYEDSSYEFEVFLNSIEVK